MSTKFHATNRRGFTYFIKHEMAVNEKTGERELVALRSVLTTKQRASGECTYVVCARRPSGAKKSELKAVKSLLTDYGWTF